MTDDRLRRWLETAEEPLSPDPTFAAALRDELRHELGFLPRDHARRSSVGLDRPGVRRPPSPARLLLAAVLVVSGAVGFAALAGSLVDRSPQPRQGLLGEIHALGRLRVAVRPDHPQVSTLGQPAAGFDVDVAHALAERLQTRAEVVLLPAPAMLTATREQPWDVALPSVATWRVDGSRFLISSRYYAWPRQLVVLESSTATDRSDLLAAPVCAVVGDEGEAWLRDASGVASSPVTADVVVATDDQGCLDLLASGAVAALVTARLSEADLRTRVGLRTIGGPEPEPRAVIIPRANDGSADPTELLDAIDAAFIEMRRDGTLTRLSQNRFGGADLTTP
ncbi:MAG TPA: transporter substrate-binding domain-containing protein [Candidatus Limnocylindrales bacterium]